jgi:small conductance mechanosensitive channel
MFAEKIVEKDIHYYINELKDALIHYIPNVVLSVLIFITGIIAIKIFRRIITSIMTKRPDHDPTLLKFVLDVCTWIFRGMIFVAIIGELGIQTTSFVALIGAAGLAVGLSLQGSLSNFAGGLLIILFKPFRVGDSIEAQGQAGTVNAIQIFNTVITTGNNQVVYMPNGALSNGTVKNFSQEALRRAEITVSVSYHSDLKLVKETLQGIIKSDSNILANPAPNIEIKQLAENSVDLNVQIWTERAKYGKMVSDFLENTKNVFEEKGIEIPYPQRDIHIKKDEINLNKA